MKTQEDNTMLCDIETGICEMPSGNKNYNGKKKSVRLLYFTDPICSSCWGIEPQLTKLKLEYGEHFDIEYRMGGLLKSWDSYGGRDVNGPASVAQHWDEASLFYQMPIDGDVWKEDPLTSSYPAAIAFKAVQMQDELKAEKFLRRIREMVFVEKKNISKIEVLMRAASEVELDTEKFSHDYYHDAQKLFEDDLQLTKEWGVKGFPTMFFIDEDDNRFKVYGSRGYANYEQALLKLVPQANKNHIQSGKQLIEQFDSVTAKELAVITDTTLSNAVATLETLAQQQLLYKITTKNGDLWKKNK